MPEFTLEEADRCPYCDRILREPPACCEAMIKDYHEDERLRWAELAKREQELYNDGSVV